MYRHSILILIAGVSVLLVLALPLYLKFSSHPAYEEFLVNNAEQEMGVLARKMVKDHQFLTPISPETVLPESFIRNVEYIRQTVGLPKIKIFTTKGIIVYSTDPADLGSRTSQVFFSAMLADGLPRTELQVFKNAGSGGEIHIIETYVPIYENGVAVGVFEIYHNISGLKQTFHRMLRDERRILLPVIILLLAASFSGSWLAYRSMTELKETRDRFEQLSVTDTLTGLLNRRGFISLVEKQLSFLKRCGKGAVLLYIDLDDFKLINDMYGHTVGDQALIEAAGILSHTLRMSDVIGRIGGDEFAALAVKNDHPDHDDLVRQRLLENLALWNSQSGARYTLAFSIGMVEYTPESLCTVDEMMNLADENMYREKQRKKSAVSAVS